MLRKLLRTALVTATNWKLSH